MSLPSPIYQADSAAMTSPRSPESEQERLSSPSLPASTNMWLLCKALRKAARHLELQAAGAISRSTLTPKENSG